MMGGPISRAAMKLARALGSAITNTDFRCGHTWADHCIYWVGAFAGTLITGFLCHTMILVRTDNQG